ncbi:MAG: tyrosine-type recombinase/integrase [Candidatus Limnocylindria bacterium]
MGRPAQATAAGLAAEFIDPQELTAGSPLRDLVRVYLQDLQDKNRSARTIPAYARYLGEFVSFVDPRDHGVTVADLDLRTVKAFATHLGRRAAAGERRRPRSPATKNLYLIALRGLLKFGLLLDLPVPAPDKVDLARAPQPSPDARHLEVERLARLLEAPDVGRLDGLRTRALLELLGATGCRISEAIALERRQVALAPEAPEPADGVRIADEVAVFGKGGRHRKVFLGRRAREWLARYLAARDDDDPALFVTRRRKANGSYRMSVWMAQKSVADAARRAGLTENVSPHWLRHAAITGWTTAWGLPAAQRLAGHRHIASTNRYLGGSDAELKQLYKRKFG